MKIGPYELRGELGRGSLGVVHRALDLALDREVAIKILASSSEAARFEREVQIAARLRHPNVVGIHGLGEHGQRPYVVMDLIEGRTLAEVLRAGPLEARRAARLVRDLADAVQQAHAAGILHRDLRPENVLVEADGNPVLSEFGLATQEGLQRRISGEVDGDPGYLAPEQVRGEPVDERSDVHGLGALLYATLTGQAPFGGARLVEVLQAVASETPRAPRSLRGDLDPALEAICMDCLAKEPAERTLSAQVLRDALDEWLAGDDAAPPARRWPVPFAACVGVGLGVLSALVVPRSSADPALAVEPTPVPAPPTPTVEEDRLADLLAAIDAASLLAEDEEGLRLCDEALALDPSCVPALVARGDFLTALDRLEEAERALDDVLRRRPEHLPGLEGRARVRIARGDEAGAEEDVERFARGGGALEALFELRYLLALLRQDHHAGLAALNELVRMRPSDGGFLIRRGELYASMERYREATQDFVRAVQTPQGAGDAGAWAYLGNLHQLLNEFPSSHAAYVRAEELGHQPAVNAKIGQAIALFELGELEGALRAAEQGQAIAPENAFCFALRGMCLFRLGRFAEARPQIEEALRREAELPPPQVGFLREALRELQATPPAPPRGR